MSVSCLTGGNDGAWAEGLLGLSGLSEDTRALGKEQKDLGQLVKTSLPCPVGGIELSDDLLVKTLIKNSLGPLVARIY